MATSTITITPRLRMTRLLPTHDKSAHSDTGPSISEAGPSRLPEVSQLVNLTLRDMEISDDNIYASDVPTDPTRQPSPPVATKTETPAAVLRALLSRLPNKDESPTHHPEHTVDLQYTSDRESDYDVETASATTSVAQSSLKNIFTRALREPGDTPRKDKSHRRRRSSISGTDAEDTPHVLEARNIKEKSRSLSDDEIDNANKTSARLRTRFKATPQPLTQQFLHERFSDSPVKRRDSARDKNASLHETSAPRLDSSQSSPPAATSTPQRSLLSFNQSRFNSNLLDKDSEMQNAFDALDSSTDKLSTRSISPIPILQIESEPVDDTKFNEVTDSKIPSRGSSLQTSLQATPRFNNNNGLPSGVPSTAKASRSKSTAYDKHDSLGEQSMSLSLPVGHINLQSNMDLSRLTNGAGRLSRQHSVTSLRSSSPMQDRPHSPPEVLHEKERSWNKPQPVRQKRSSHHSPSSSMRPVSPIPNRNPGSSSPVEERNWNSPHHSRAHSFSSPRPKSPMYRPESPADPIHERERNWNSPHPKWHDGSLLHDTSLHNMSRDSDFSNGHIHPHRTPAKPRNPPSRPLSPLPPDSTSSVTRASSLLADRHTRSLPQSTPSSPSSPTSRPDFSSVATSSPRRRPATPAGKEPKVSASMPKQTSEVEGEISRGQAVPYAWPVISSDHRQAQPKVILNGHAPGNGSETDDVRETDYSSSVDTPKSRPIEPPDIPDGRQQSSEASEVPNGYLTPSTLPIVVQADTPDLPSTPPRKVVPKGVKLELKTPSPPKQLPDLPTPSSSDESNDGPLMKVAKIPKLGTAYQNKWLQTPKPPGGWLATPQTVKSAEDNVFDGRATLVPTEEDRIPETPVTWEANRFPAKTPKPPGGWATPAPTSLKSAESDDPEDNGQRSQLLTPINSLSRGSALNSKTPGAPGGWANTPAPRKSILKVRFDSQDPEVKGDPAPESRGEDSNVSELDNPLPGDVQDVSLPSPRSPRRPKVNIRVLDAFGREETPSSSPKKGNNASRNGIRMLDAMGHDIKEEQIEEQDTMKESTKPLARDVLLSRLRQGLNELAEDIDVVDKEGDIFSSDHRIGELVATSRQAREVRAKLSSQAKKTLVPPAVTSSYISFSWKMCFGLILAQVLLLFLMYRISLIQVKNFFLNAYYDPFNPELYKSENTVYLPRLDSSLGWPRDLLRGGDSWSTWLGSIDVAAYLSTLLSMDVMERNAWTPT